MKIKFKETQVGHTFVFLGGKIYDLPQNEALDWIRNGRAVLSEDEPVKEDRSLKDKTATKPRRTAQRTEKRPVK